MALPTPASEVVFDYSGGDKNIAIIAPFAAIKKMDKIEAARIRVTAGQVGVVRGGVTTTAISAAEEQVTHHNRPRYKAPLAFFPVDQSQNVQIISTALVIDGTADLSSGFLRVWAY